MTTTFLALDGAGLSEGGRKRPGTHAQIRPRADDASFVAGGESRPTRSTSASVNQSTKRPKEVARLGVLTRVRKGDLDRVTAYLPVELGAQLRMFCAVRRIELSEAIAEALNPWLAKNG
jgi:hypothetical protein